MKRLALVVVAVFALAGVAYAATASGPQTYAGTGGNRTGLRPTGLGLPEIGATGSVGFAEYGSALRAYHDSGTYMRDVATVDTAATKKMNALLAARKNRGKAKCRTVYRRVTVRVVGKKGKVHKQRLFRRTKVCATPSLKPLGKPAIVLDIDETSLSNYQGLEATNFSIGGEATSAATGMGTAIAPTLKLFNAAKKRKVAVFFVTGRPSVIDPITKSNLQGQGFSGWQALYEKPSDQTTEAFKSGTRANIQKQGYDILVNVGDQESDLDGGHADAAFKLPNPYYFIGDQ